jgi:hypothetical protein
MVKGYGDLVASSMERIMKSAEHKSLFKKADFGAEVSSSKDSEKSHECPMCGEGEKLSDEQFAMNKSSLQDGSMPSEFCEVCKEDSKDGLSGDFEVSSEDQEFFAKDKEEKEETMSDDKMKSEAMDEAIKSLIQASASLEAIGFEKTSGLALQLAGFVVEAKKTDKEKEAEKKAKEKAKAEKMKAKEKADKEKAKAKAEKEKEKAKKEKEEMAAKSKKMKQKKEEEEKAKKALEADKKKAK